MYNLKKNQAHRWQFARYSTNPLPPPVPDTCIIYVYQSSPFLLHITSTVRIMVPVSMATNIDEPTGPGNSLVISSSDKLTMLVPFTDNTRSPAFNFPLKSAGPAGRFGMSTYVIYTPFHEQVQYNCILMSQHQHRSEHRPPGRTASTEQPPVLSIPSNMPMPPCSASTDD